MKIPLGNGRLENQDLTLENKAQIDELEGYQQLGMEAEVLALCRKWLVENHFDGTIFFAVLHAILAHADRLSSWRQLIDSAYQRLPRSCRRESRCLMLSYFCCISDYETAETFLPRRFTGHIILEELSYGLDIMLALNRLREASHLAAKCLHAISQSLDPVVCGLLELSLANYFARIHDWVKSITLYEKLLHNEFYVESAALELIELHSARALLAIQTGLDSISCLKKAVVTDLELELPGNAQARWQEANAKLQKKRKLLTRTLPKANWKHYGISC